ncbi:sodium:proton antiporter [Secundilactobacillus kimchicus]|uniref:NhaP-type Na+ H+ and K+ H+ antiporter n=1 Tax=Secundilactobacillus kimchicus JCM 15530 TaxID=1302272 RepID=A0A0R1HNK4_9LACO|nr:sodium:proton antiporter [Secundilactobacillus kimchicus]KRK48108.1 NhaP-type Na+ H+ and K+ H+ antiporter [Secundilactobacillus kimchicus JCM 15530]MBT9670927.1 sodium:proton antiporter [Secundilactobacillus kimchicus]
MPIIEAVILLVALVLVSNILSHYLTFIPVSLIQVTLGLVVALFWNIEIDLDTDWFLLLFIAPLLFNDGRRFPKRELWKLRGPIFANAIGLVFVTTIVGGYLMYLMIPKMPLTVSFAVAAILSPTDPVAVQSISKRANLPENILHLVSGESLINDASGLIAFKYAVAATVTGVFSLSGAVGDFFYISLVGLLSGFILQTVVELLRDILRRQGINDVIFNTVLQLITPFIVYVITEEVAHASGVIAVVTAGVLSHAHENRLVEDLPELRLVTEKTWDIIIYLLNGVVFLILGIELPLATTNIIKSTQFSTTQAILYALGAWLILLLIRVAWIYLYEGSVYLRQRKRKPSLRVALMAGLSGVRGAITMAGVLSLPLLTATGSAFPQRSLALFVAAGVIIISLVAAVISLPLVAPDNPIPLRTRASLSDEDEEADDAALEPATTVRKMTEAEARIYIMRLAINAIEENRRQENQRAAYDLILDYQFLIRRMELKVKDDTEMQRVLTDEMQLRTIGLDGEQSAVERLFEHNQISMQSYRSALRRIERARQRLTQVSGRTVISTLKNWNKWLRQFARRLILRLSRANPHDLQAEWQLIDRESSKAAIKALSKHLAADPQKTAELDKQAIYHLVVYYRNRIERTKQASAKFREKYQQQTNRLRILALGAERSGIQSLLEAGNIPWQMASRLRQYINYSENLMMMTVDDGDPD